MKKILLKIRDNYSRIYKVFIFIASIFFIVLLFPREGKFKYELQKGKPWMHEDLIAPFDFGISKTSEEISAEKDYQNQNFKPYFTFDESVYQKRRDELENNFNNAWEAKYPVKNNLLKENLNFCVKLFDSIYNRGILRSHQTIDDKTLDFEIFVLKSHVATEKSIGDFFTIKSSDEFIRSELKKHKNIDGDLMIPVIENEIIQNVVFDEETTKSAKLTLLSNVSLTKGMVQKGEKVISKGELITLDKFKIIESLKIEYEQQLGASQRYYAILLGQIILVSITIIVLILFLVSFKKDIFDSNKKIIFLLLLIYMMVFATAQIIKINVTYLYLLPICLVPIIVRVFFEPRLALFIHIITIILIGFLVPNSFEFIFIQLISGIVAVTSIVNVRKRSQLFLTSLLVFISYCAIYIGLNFMQEGSIENIPTYNFTWFAGSALLTLFAYPLIFIFEKIFGFVTEISLMELTDSNTKLLRELSQKAPGTFQHSLQVANLAEDAIMKIGGNTLLVRAGALYHDIGKIDMPIYFVENQTTKLNPHDELPYDESARIITSHVIKGIEIAKQNKLPEQIIDFIRTHHGTNKTGYFYRLFIKNNIEETVSDDIFTYHGPVPFSKETAVIMMADSVEAASRTLANTDETTIDTLVENIIDNHINNKQFANSDITFKDITIIKKVFKKNLINKYHVRIEYPI